MTLYLSTKDGNPSSEKYSEGSTDKLFTTGSTITIPEPIFYDESYQYPVAEGTYYAAPDDSYKTIIELTVNSSGVLTNTSEVDSGDSVMLPSCSYLGQKLDTDPQALVNDVRAELLKLRNNPMALGTITNRIVYLIMNGQAAPRAYDTRFVKPIQTVERIYKKAKDGSDGGEAARFAYTYFNDSELIGDLYYAGGTTIGLGTSVFSDAKLSSAAPDGTYSNEKEIATVSLGVVSEYS